MTFRFHRDARDEYLESVAYYEDEHPGLGLRFIQAVEAGIATVVEDPLRWRQFEGPLRRYLIEDFPFHLIYGVKSGEVIFVAMSHCSREPGFWRERYDERP